MTVTSKLCDNVSVQVLLLPCGGVGDSYMGIVRLETVEPSMERFTWRETVYSETPGEAEAAAYERSCKRAAAVWEALAKDREGFIAKQREVKKLRNQELKEAAQADA